ncbi:MAG: glycosyltransferase [Opitutales bacterium]|nr:glycosyltransferase [Opitutales bacterium]
MVDDHVSVESIVWPKVSIVVPVLNQVRFLDEALRSVLDQGYPNLELVVMDGGSTDGSLDIIERYSARIAHWESVVDNGQSHAISKGLARCSGDLFNWLNGDDVLVEGSLLSAATHWIEKGKPAMIYGRADKVDEMGRCIKRGVYRPFDRRLLLDLYYITQPSCFYSREVMNALGGIDTACDFAMDWDLAVRMARDGRVESVDELWSRLRVYPSTKTSIGGIRRAREIARIGFKYSGFRSKNFWVFHAMNSFELVGALKGRTISLWMRKALDTVFSKIWDPNGFMVHLKDFERGC